LLLGCAIGADVAVASEVGVGVLIDERVLVAVGVVGGRVSVDVSAGVFVGSDVGVVVGEGMLVEVGVGV